MCDFSQVQKLGRVLAGGALLALVGFTQVSLADDWVAVKLRGNVFAFNGSSWDKLERGSIVSDSRPIRTTRSGRAEFTRAKESITVGGDTEISISDRLGERYTVVNQKIGKVEIEAERRNVQHFAVRTPFIAAVVKGTKFTVIVQNGQAQIDVTRGTVSAQDPKHNMKADVTPGQTASAGQSESLHVSGQGDIAPITDFAGNVVSTSVASNGNGNGNGNGNSGSGNNGNGNGNGGDNNGNSGSANNGNGNGNSGSSNNGNGNSGNNNGGGHGGNNNGGGHGGGNNGGGNNGRGHDDDD